MHLPLHHLPSRAFLTVMEGRGERSVDLPTPHPQPNLNLTPSPHSHRGQQCRVREGMAATAVVAEWWSGIEQQHHTCTSSSLVVPLCAHTACARGEKGIQRMCTL